MTLSIRGDISPNGIVFQCAAASGSTFLLGTTEAKIRKYTVGNTTLQLAASATLGGVSPSSMTFISPASVMISYSGSNRFDLYDVNTLANTAISTNATSTFRLACEQIAGNGAGLALATSSTTGRITMVSLTCAAAINPPVLSSKTARCVIYKADTSTWLVGTNSGQIHEFNSAGSLLTTVNVASTPFVTAPTICVNSLSYYNNMVLACTDSGQMMTYTWPTGTLINRIPMGSSSSSTSVPVLCPSVSGVTLATNQSSVSTNFKGIEEIYFETGQISIDSTYFTEVSAGILETGFEPIQQQYAWSIQNENNALMVRIYNVTNPAKAPVETRIQDPIGGDIAGRIIRIRDCNGVGNAVVELDQTIFPGPAGLLASEDRNYIEIALEGNIVNGNPPYTKWDVREFQS